MTTQEYGNAAVHNVVCYVSTTLVILILDFTDNNVHSLEVVDRVSEIQLRVS